MNQPEKIFFASVLIGAAGLAYTLAPDGSGIGFAVIGFSLEAIRAGIVLINVEVRKISVFQYGIVLCAAIIATVGVGFAINSIDDISPSEWWIAQTTNFLILAGEYSWAIIRAGVPVDWEFEYRKLERALKESEKRSEELDEVRLRLAHAEGELAGESSALRSAKGKISTLKDEAEKASAKIKQLTAVKDSTLAVAEKKISVNRVGAAVCQCGILIAPNTNSHKPETCECGKKINW